MESLSDSIASENVLNGQRIIILLLEFCWDLLFPYLYGADLANIDSALTEKSLRAIYFKQVDKFYLSRIIWSVCELEWIMRRGISLTVCRLNFRRDGEVIQLIIIRLSIIVFAFIY